MEKQEKYNIIVRIFTHLMRDTINRNFVFPGGGIAKKTVGNCIDSLENAYKGELTIERLIDFCVCQVYSVSQYNKDLLKRWNVSHSFGNKAFLRFCQYTKGKRYFEDVWLKDKNLSRSDLLDLFREKKSHPLQKFVNPEYEESTKKRMLNSEVGFYICRISTLLWNPFSESCGVCKSAEQCKQVLQLKYSELYRLRIEESTKNKKG